MSLDFSNLRLTVVDDSSYMRWLVRKVLEAFDIKDVVEAEDGSGALAELKRRMPDIVLVDFAMEPMDGIAFTRRVRQGEDSPNIYLPIIMMTGYTEMHRVIEARDAGVTEIVAKPVAAASLYSRLAAVIERPRPFIRAGTFFGPDRRRRQVPFDGPDRRAGEDDLMDI
jgi:two-component system chemotaxis response regulator CheY